MAAAAKSLGWHAFPGPAAINSQVYDSRPACCVPRLTATGAAATSNAKNSTAASTIPKAQDTGRLKVVTQAHVTTIAVDERSGRVTGVNYVKGGQEFSAGGVVLLRGLYL